MENREHLALQILHALDIVILNRSASGEYTIYGTVPEFYERCFPSTDAGPCTRPWIHSPMLEHFLEDVEMFFSRNVPGSINTGVWQEDGLCDEDQALYAQAVIFDNAQFLIIRRLKDDFNERVKVLRKAREQLLERRLLNNDLEIYKRKARFDGLTQVLNKEACIERLKKEIEAALENASPLALAIVDIDHFKHVNDKYGHLCGDAVLASLGQVLRTALRREDTVARFGGEEFVIVTPFSTLHQIWRAAEKLRKTIAGYDFSPVPRVTVSIGCTAYVRGDTWENLLQRADLALYEAKHSGRNKVRIR